MTPQRDDSEEGAPHMVSMKKKGKIIIKYSLLSRALNSCCFINVIITQQRMKICIYGKNLAPNCTKLVHNDGMTSDRRW